jgi:hypothetical protein
VNAAKCGRVHCAFTGPLYIGLSLLHKIDGKLQMTYRDNVPAPLGG